MATAATSLSDQAITETVERALARWPQHAARIERAATLLRIGAIRKLGAGRYSVRSANAERSYTVTMPDDGAATCECPDVVNRSRGCKHAWGVYLFSVSAVRFEVLVARRAPDPATWSPDQARRLMFARWLVAAGRMGED